MREKDIQTVLAAGQRPEAVSDEVLTLRARVAELEAQVAKAREDTARRCVEIVSDNRCSDCRHWDDRLTGALHCADEAIADIRREFGIDAAREKGGK